MGLVADCRLPFDWIGDEEVERGGKVEGFVSIGRSKKNEIGTGPVALAKSCWHFPKIVTGRGIPGVPCAPAIAIRMVRMTLKFEIGVGCFCAFESTLRAYSGLVGEAAGLGALGWGRKRRGRVGSVSGRASDTEGVCCE